MECGNVGVGCGVIVGFYKGGLDIVFIVGEDGVVVVVLVVVNVFGLFVILGMDILWVFVLE